MSNLTKELIAFIKNSPTPFHVVSNVESMFETAGYQRLDEGDKWIIKAKGKYYVTRGDSSIIAFELCADAVEGMNIAAAHSDSPCFKLKTNPEKNVENTYVTLNTEKYGGSIMPTWLDRPLGIAGRVVVKNGDKLNSILVDLKKDVALIPNLAIHMNPDINKGKNYDAQVDMLPLIGSAASKGKLMSMVAKSANVKESDILASDLFLYNAEDGKIWGVDKEYVSAPRLDDLQCVFGLVKGMIESAPARNKIKLCAIFNNEEVGSTTMCGADSTFLTDTVERIFDGVKVTDKRHEIIANSMLISADNAHALHPNHPEVADPTNRPVMNGGIVIKHNANQKYTTDAVSEGFFVSLCREASVQVQHYCNKSTIAGGSTLGNISTSHLSISSVDIGLPQLAMHSAYETAGVKDVDDLIAVMKIYW